MTTILSTRSPAPGFLGLFVTALAIRIGVVALGLALIPVQPERPILIAGFGVAGFPAELRPSDRTPDRVRTEILAGSGRVIEPWYRWDAVWMATVAENGYGEAADQSGRNGVAFMPVMPACLALGAALGLNPYWFALAAANLAGAAGAAVFARVAARLLNDRAAGWRAMALLLAFPTAFFYSAPYNESFGLLFTALALEAWQMNRPGWAGLCAIGGSLARLTGVALGAAAVADWLTTRRRENLPRDLALALGSAAGLLVFGGILWWAVGNPLAGLSSHGAWGRRSASIWNPWYAIESIYDPDLVRPGGGQDFWGEATVAGVVAILGVRAWWKRGLFWGVLALTPIAQMLASGTLLSAHRVVLASLPAFIELADLLQRPIWRYAAILVFGAGQLALLNRYVHWQFAG
jgi:hypothetical protein